MQPSSTAYPATAAVSDERVAGDLSQGRVRFVKLRGDDEVPLGRDAGRTVIP